MYPTLRIDYSHNPNSEQLISNSLRRDKNMSNSSSKGTALITGASRGIGAVYADRLAKRGYDLMLVARSEAPLQALAATLSRSTGRRTTPIVADVNNKQDLARVEAKLKDDPSITMLVNNAGFASVAPLLEADIEKMEEMIALNISALTRLTYVAAPAFVKRGAGTIINIGSAAGISVEAMNGVYGASKAYPCLQSFATARTHQQGHSRPSGVTRQDRDRRLGRRRLPMAKDAPGDRHAGRRHGRRSAGRSRSGRTGHNSPLHNGDEWTRFEAIRRGMLPQFGTSVPAPRYRKQARRSA